MSFSKVRTNFFQAAKMGSKSFHPMVRNRASLAYKGAFLVKEDRVLKGPLGSSLRSFARTAHSAHSLRNTTLASLARSVHGLAHSLRSLPHGIVEILEYVFTLLSRSTRTNAFLALTRNTP